MSNRKLPEYVFYKEDENSKMWQVDHIDADGSPLLGEMLYSFDKKKIYNLWEDYPHNFTEEERKIFEKEEPYWADFFKTRKE